MCQELTRFKHPTISVKKGQNVLKPAQNYCIYKCVRYFCLAQKLKSCGTYKKEQDWLIIKDHKLLSYGSYVEVIGTFHQKVRKSTCGNLTYDPVQYMHWNKITIASSGHSFPCNQRISAPISVLFWE